MARQQDIKIVGRLKGTFEDLHGAGCIQTLCDMYADVGDAVKAGGLERFSGIMLLTRLNPCDGCPNGTGMNFNPGKIITRVDQIQCSAFQKFHTMAVDSQLKSKRAIWNATTPPGTDNYPGLSVKQIAEKLGISKNEVRRRKQVGTL